MKYLLLAMLSSLCAAQYSLEDLGFLENERNYGEFFRHAQDIRPTHRGEHWQKMVKTMGHSYLQKYLSLELYPKEAYQIILELSSWPILYRDLKFQKFRAQFGKGYFTQCFQKTAEEQIEAQCINNMRRYFDQGSKLPQESLDILELLKRQKLTFSKHAFAYIRPILNDSNHGKHCAHPTVKSTLLQKLNRIRYTNFSTLKNWAKKHISPLCLKYLAKGLKSYLYSPNFSNATVAFDLLYVSNKISQSERDFFLTRNYLQRFQKGDRLNLSWNTLKDLAKNFERRQKVLDHLKELDPLPDRLFGAKPTPGKNILIDHLANHFPEYLDAYSQNCLNYLQGAKAFPNGNPTIHCRQIMEEAKGKGWIPPRKLSLYQEAKIKL